VTNDSYWNRENFEGLAALASTLREDARLEPLGRYCELREKGLRREAFAELDRFLAGTASWDVATQRSIALTVLAANRSAPDAHQFLSEPIRRRFIEPVLDRWREDEPGNAVPLGELGLLRRDQRLLTRALELDPADDRVRAALAAMLLEYVAHATHHLVEGTFIGSEADAASALAEASDLLAGISDPAAVRYLRYDLEDLRRLLADWQEYQLAPTGSFPEWCRERNRDHRWSSIYYYRREAG
jgi:hypothetical protein